MEDRQTGRRGDALIAFALAVLLGAMWAVRDRAQLSVLHLPDTDDVMRLQQVRDWLGGQAFADLTQHRLGTGVPMHWSRLADLGPAALIVLFRPLLGQHGAELFAVVAWPPLLFAAALFLVARIARQVGGAPLAGVAAVIAAIGYPATTIFLPGRIDHHGLQMVLLLGATLAVLRGASVTAGAAIGLLAAASLIIGLETAPMFAMIGAVALAGWIAGERCAARRLAGLGLGALAGLVVARGVFAPAAWAYPACDGFTAQAWQPAMWLVPAPLVLAALDRPLTGMRARSLASLAVGGAAVAAALAVSPACLSPYGRVDPALAALWLRNVGEAQPLFGAPPATALGYAGVMVAGIVASAWRLKVERRKGWAVLLALQLAALAVTVVQLRGAYAGALLAAPGLAAVVVAARGRGILSLVGAWLVSAGMLYPLAAEALTPVPAASRRASGDCGAPTLLARLAQLKPGVVIAPIDLGAYGIGATAHRFLAAPYHRDTAGNLAMYGFYRGSPTAAARIALRWHADYLVVCGAMPGIDMPGSMAAALAAGHDAGWSQVARSADGSAILVRDPLYDGGGPH